ncbi:DoxX family protein [Haliangium ochraceum]|uniref:DoxX family protein n=1 Tax=Haliangium ochraceum (strain DSM 14365 / JCM 11303 / SMP-2) TaxID=502025 RepID=D0LX95_HALO1|nr:DoxX family protein [Haliangium ochraceum]ACY16137.1 DoxX family protein [Haliangium ochraceum DSM 14365]
MTKQTSTSLGLLLLRVSIASMMLFGHGLPKLLDFGEKSANFPDPLGIGNTVSMAAAVFGEVVCAAFIIVGLFTRAAAIPFLFTMLVAAFVVHSADPWAKKEFAILYAIPALSLLFTGAGAFSIDGWRKRST